MNEYLTSGYLVLDGFEGVTMVLQLFQTQCPLPLCSSEASILILAAELYDSLPAVLLIVSVAFSTWACSPQLTTPPPKIDLIDPL